MYILAIDQGTSSTRAILFDLNGQMIRESSIPLTQYFPKPKWVEHDPDEIWEHTLKVLKKVCANIKSSDLLACGISNQRETTVCWDKRNGQVLSRAIAWQDRRTQADCDQLKAYEALIFKKTGLQCDPYFSASKLRWILKNHSTVDNKHIAFGTIDCFLLWRLTGGLIHQTDITNASRTMLFNIHEQCWDLELLELFHIPLEILPKVRDSDSYFGDIKEDILGFKLPIHAVLGDQQAALIGLGCTQKNDIKITYGTCGNIMQNTGSTPCPSNIGLTNTIAYRVQHQTYYALEGNIYDSGSMLFWLKDKLKLFLSYDDIEPMVSSLSNNDGVYFIPSFSGLGAPHWLPAKGASFVGMSRATTSAHLVRAALESLVYQTNDILKLMRKHSSNQIKVDGGVASSHWLIHLLADLTKTDIIIPEILENTAKGVAMVASLSVHKKSDLKQLSLCWQQFKLIKAEPSTALKEAYAGWLKALENFKN